MIYFDELSVAQEMEASTTAVDEYKRSDLLLYAKYWRYKPNPGRTTIMSLLKIWNNQTAKQKKN